MNSRRLLLYLLLNAIVSAAVTLAVLWVWSNTHPTPPCAEVKPAPPGIVAPTVELTRPTPRLPTAAPFHYIVQSGDTLGTIAEKYGVSLEALLMANNLSDPNLLQVGDELIIPASGPTFMLNPTPAVEASPQAAGTPIPTATRDPNAPQARLIIREVKAAGQWPAEALVIANQGGPVDLAGWTLRDEAGRVYTFPSLTLFEGGAVNVHSGAGADTVTDLYWGQSGALWVTGQKVLLSDAAGNLVSTLVIP